MILTGDPRLDSPMKRIITAVLTVGDWNDPRCSSQGGGRSGKPSSRPPGMQHCQGAARALSRALADCAKAAERIVHGTFPLELGSDAVVSVGSVDVRIPAQPGPHVNRRGDGTFTMPKRELVVGGES